MSGRVGKLQGALASLLSVKPIITVREGMLEVMGSVRTRARALARVVDLIEQKLGSGVPVNLGVIQARSPEDGAWLEEHARARLNCREVLTADLVASLAVHGGPGVVGLFGYQV
jgi:fatty acid-binding protein DegV